MTTFQSWFGGTNFVLDLPQYAAFAPGTALVALVGVAALVRTRSISVGVSIVVGVVVSMGVHTAARGVFPLIESRMPGSPIVMFPRAINALALFAAACTWSVCAAGGAVLDRLARRAAGREYAVAIVGLLLSITGFAYAARIRAELGPPQRQLPVLLGAGNWRVQVGATIHASTQLGRRDVGLWIFRRAEVPLEASERATLRAECYECERDVTGVTVGRNALVFRARVGPYALHRMVGYDVEDARGDARFPLRVGARWTFRERLESTTREGGWASAMVNGPSHLAPRAQSSDHLSDRRRELRVERSFVEGGIRFWELHYEDAGDERTMIVYGHNGLTWVVGDRRDPWQSRELLIEGAPPRDPRLRVVGAGVFSCRIRGLDFTHCGDGSNPRIPFGPVRGGARDSSGQGLFIAAITLGALVPGEGARWAYCLEQYTEGTGVEMPVWRHTTPPLASNDPRGERFALCSPPTSAPSERAAQPRPSRRTTTRASGPRTSAGVWFYE